jgi:hypothetical protein
MFNDMFVSYGLTARIVYHIFLFFATVAGLDYPQTAKRLARRPRAELARRCLSSLV